MPTSSKARSVSQLPGSKPSACTLFSASFSQDTRYFACATDQGFRIYTCVSFKESIRTNCSHGGIGLVEMLFGSNIVAFVGCEGNKEYPPNKVMFWDDHMRKCIGDIEIPNKVLALKLRRDRVVVVTECFVYVFNFEELKHLYTMRTVSNPKGLCAVSATSVSMVLACPAECASQVRVQHNGITKTRVINAHDSAIACLALTSDGVLLASASTNGTVIRVFNSFDGTRLQEARRGFDRAEIYSIAFSPTAKWLVMSSDKGTVHLFDVNPKAVRKVSEVSSNKPEKFCKSHTVAHPDSSPLSMKGVSPKYLNSQRSFAQFSLPDSIRSLVGFRTESTIFVLVCNGRFYRCAFDASNGGEVVQKEYHEFLKCHEEF